MDAATRVPVGMGIPYHLRSGNLFMRYVDDDHIIINDNVVTYDEIKNAYNVFMNPELYDGASTVELAHHDIVLSQYEVELIMESLNNIRCEDGTNYVSRKEDMEYDDLCTLESLLSYFKHDASLDKEIANLKEESLLTTIKYLNKDLKEVSRCRDAMMVMTFINPADIPEDKWSHIIKSGMSNPTLLLNFVDEDVELEWPIPKTIDMINESMDSYVTTINHGLRSKGTAGKEDE